MSKDKAVIFANGDKVTLDIPLSYPVRDSWQMAGIPKPADWDSPKKEEDVLISRVSPEDSAPPNILQEALDITGRQRPGQYGHPADHFARTVGQINALFTEKVRQRLDAGQPMFLPEDWGVIMIIDKLSRFVHVGQRDSLVDTAGYARTIEMVRERLSK